MSGSSSLPPEGKQGKQIGTADRVMTRAVTGTHRLLLQATGGRFINRMGGNDVGILTTVGRRSGVRRSHPVIVTADGADKLVVATNGGSANHPSWLRNLVANPDVELRLGTVTTPMRASLLSTEEKAELWPTLVASYGMYETMQNKTDRDIPVVRLTPAS